MVFATKTAEKALSDFQDHQMAMPRELHAVLESVCAELAAMKGRLDRAEKQLAAAAK